MGGGLHTNPVSGISGLKIMWVWVLRSDEELQPRVTLGMKRGSTDPHYPVGNNVCVYVWRFPRVERLHWDGLSSFLLISMQRGPAAYTRPWRLKYLPLCLPGMSWLTTPPQTHTQARTHTCSHCYPITLSTSFSLFLELHLSFSPPPVVPVSKHQSWLWASYTGSVDNRLFEWQILIPSHSNGICSRCSVSPAIKMSQADLQVHELPNKAYFSLGL